MKNDSTLKYFSSAVKTLMVLVVFMMGIAIAQIIIIELSRTFVLLRYRTFEHTQKPVGDEISRIRRSSKYFMPDGTVHQLVYEDRIHHNYDDEDRVLLYDANDELVWQGVKKEIPYQYLAWPEQLRNWSDTLDERYMHRMSTVTPELSGSIEFAERENGEIEYIWRYIQKKQYFAAYSLESGIVGYIGATGFKERISGVTGFGQFKLLTAWCPEDSENPVMLWQTKSKIYQIDFQNRDVKLILESEKELVDKIVLKNWMFTGNQDANAIKYRPAILSKTSDETYYLVMRQPEQIFTLTVPEDWNDTSVSLTATEGGIFLLRSYYGPTMPEEYKKSEKLVTQWRRQIRNMPKERWRELYRVNEGKELNLINRYEWTIPPYKSSYSAYNYDNANKVEKLVVNISPPAYSLLWQRAYKYWSISFFNDETIFHLFGEIVEELRSKDIVINWCISFVLVAVAVWHNYNRRTNWFVLVMWLGVVALFSIAGFLTYWALNHNTVVKCHSCGRKRHLKQPECVHCGGSLAVPEKRPTDLVMIS